MKMQNDSLKLEFSEKFAAYNLESRILPGAKLQSSFEIKCTCKEKNYHLLENFRSISKIGHIETLQTRFGSLEIENMKIETVLKDVEVNIRIGLEKNEALAFIQLELHNNCDQSLFIDQLTLLVINDGCLFLGSTKPTNFAFYSNGWQSWSSSGTYHLGDRQHKTRLGKYQNSQIINPSTPCPKDGRHFSGDMFGVVCDLNSRNGLMAGFLSQKTHFGSLEAAFEPGVAFKIWSNGDHTRLDTGQTIQTDWACLGFIDLDDLDPMKAYLEAVAREHAIESRLPVPVGWCSWYHFYQNITQEDIESNLHSVIDLKDKVPLPLLQIDDGFETFPGDWFNFTPGFPDGVKPLAEKAAASGLAPGLWLAPFIVHPRAKLVKVHPDWLLHDDHGKLVSAGFVWNTFTYALDITHPDALAYACQVICTAVQDWGFKYLKLDFLYAAALEGKHQDPTKTRAQILREGLNALRQAAGSETILLACGCPLGSALGLFDAMRIGADVSGHWEPHFPPLTPLIKNEVNMPSARNALQNILTRAPLHRRWWINDPDCLLVRPDTDLTLAEVQSLATAIGLTGGSLLVSDDLPTLPAERLRIAQVMLPLIDQRAYVLDLFQNHTPSIIRLDLENDLGSWHLLGLFNWDDQPASLEFSNQKFHLPKDQVFWCREFWYGQIRQMGPGSPMRFQDVPSHGVRVIAARSYTPDQPTYLGSNIHLSQGLEISQWEVSSNNITLQLELGRQASGKLYVYLPWKVPILWDDLSTYCMQEEGQSIYSIAVKEINRKRFQMRG